MPPGLHAGPGIADVEHFYSQYKAWKKDWTGTQVSFNGWGDVDAAKKIIRDSIDMATKA